MKIVQIPKYIYAVLLRLIKWYLNPEKGNKIQFSLDFKKFFLTISELFEILLASCV